jgi:hypothetical protein
MEKWPLLENVMNMKTIYAVQLVLEWVRSMRLDEVNVQLVLVIFSKLAYLEKDTFLNDMLFLLNKLTEKFKLEFSTAILTKLIELREFKEKKEKWRNEWEKNVKYQLKLNLKLDKLKPIKENLKKFKEEMFLFIDKLQIQNMKMKVIKNKKTFNQEEIDKKTLIYSLHYIDIYKLDRLASLSDKDKDFQSAFDATRKLINFRWKLNASEEKEYKQWLKRTYERAIDEKPRNYTKLEDLRYEKIHLSLKTTQNRIETQKIQPGKPKFLPEVENDEWCKMKDLFEDVNLRKAEKLEDEIED